MQNNATNWCSMVDDLADHRKPRKLLSAATRETSMKPWMAIFVLSGLLAAATSSAQPIAPVVEITGGKLSGAVQDGEGLFKNIPFAAPPVGDLRWREPQSVAAWTGTRDGRAFGHACMQPNAPDTSENCLTLNVWTPEWPVRSKHAVMVWFHGGGNTEGWTNTPFFDGSALAKHGAVRTIRRAGDCERPISSAGDPVATIRPRSRIAI